MRKTAHGREHDRDPICSAPKTTQETPCDSPCSLSDSVYGFGMQREKTQTRERYALSHDTRMDKNIWQSSIEWKQKEIQMSVLDRSVWWIVKNKKNKLAMAEHMGTKVLILYIKKSINIFDSKVSQMPRAQQSYLSAHHWYPSDPQQSN